MSEATIDIAALVFEASIARETGMYFVAPCVVPLVSARNGMRPGQVRSSKWGNRSLR